MAGRKKSKSSKKSEKKTRAPKVWTATAILADWEVALKKGLAKTTLDPLIAKQFEAPLMLRIQQRLDNKGDYNKDGPNTRAVGTDLGKICGMLAGSNNQVTLAMFEAAFGVCKLHHRCPSGGGGGGQWCDI